MSDVTHEELVEHLIEAHGAHRTLRFADAPLAQLRSSHWASHARGRQKTKHEHVKENR